MTDKPKECNICLVKEKIYMAMDEYNADIAEINDDLFVCKEGCVDKIIKWHEEKRKEIEKINDLILGNGDPCLGAYKRSIQKYEESTNNMIRLCKLLRGETQ
jgi:hypothetical protein